MYKSYRNCFAIIYYELFEQFLLYYVSIEYFVFNILLNDMSMLYLRYVCDKHFIVCVL